MLKRNTLLLMLLCLFCSASAANYLTFTAGEDGASFWIIRKGADGPDVQYSLDGGESWNVCEVGKRVRLKKMGDKALLKGENPDGFSRGEKSYTHFVMSGPIYASGSVMSLIDGAKDIQTIPNDYCFYGLFERCSSLQQAPELPATTLSAYCYSRMFRKCSSLRRMPLLPATVMAEGCYQGMFCYCNNLMQVSSLPSTTLAERCYEDMFLHCRRLVYTPTLPATRLAPYCYNGMFFRCVSMTEAPALPATMLADECYAHMFEGCSNLAYVKVAFIDWWAEDHGERWRDGVRKERLETFLWLSGVSDFGTFVCSSDLSIVFDVNRVPKDWKVVFFDE